jgi:hypothetical protein
MEFNSNNLPTFSPRSEKKSVKNETFRSEPSLFAHKDDFEQRLKQKSLVEVSPRELF